MAPAQPGISFRKKLIIGSAMVVATAGAIGFATKMLSPEAAILAICVMYFSIRVLG